MIFQQLYEPLIINPIILGKQSVLFTAILPCQGSLEELQSSKVALFEMSLTR